MQVRSSRKGRTLDKERYWWSEYGDFPPEDERERAPSPQNVLEAYRVVGKVELPQLAEEMHLSVQMVRRIFHQGDGLDSIQRRRILGMRLKVPPQLLGLDTLHWKKKTQNPCWWTDEGYPAFPKGEEGYPDAGEVVRWYRTQKKTRNLDRELIPWRQEDLGEAFVPSLSLESMNRMEKHGIGLDSMTRRRALVTLLGIPPVLLGLDGSKPERSIPHQPHPTLLLSRGLTDDLLLGFEQRQEALWTEYYTNHGQGAVGEMNLWIPYLQDSVLPQARNDQQYMRVRRIEQRYHGLIGNIAGEQLDFREAIFRANILVAIAQEMEDTEYLVLALRFRAKIYREQGPLFYKMAQADIDRALALIKQSAQEKKAIAPPISGLLTQEAGLVHFFTAHVKDEREVAKSLMRQAEKLTQQAVGEVDTHMLKQDLGYYHINAAMALIAWHNPVTLKEHLDEAVRLTDPALQRRHLMIKIVRVQGRLSSAKNSKGLMQDEHYAEATALATEALSVAEKLNSRLNREHVQQIYNELNESPYGEEPAVARLGLLLEQ
jgi:hypothetical protein